MSIGRELEWDDVIKDDSDFVELPEGDYGFEIDHYERGRFAGSDKTPPCKQMTVFFRIIASDGREAIVRDNYPLHTNFEWKLSQLFCGVGLKKKGEELRMNWDALPGLKGRAKITLDPDRNNPSRKYNHIKEIYALQDAQAAVENGNKGTYVWN